MRIFILKFLYAITVDALYERWLMAAPGTETENKKNFSDILMSRSICMRLMFLF